MSIWNEHLCNLLRVNNRRRLKRGEFRCPLCGESVPTGELRAHAAEDDKRFRDGLVIARIKQDHPEWVEQDGACPKCVDFYRNTVAMEKIPNRPHRPTETSTPPWVR